MSDVAERPVVVPPWRRPAVLAVFAAWCVLTIVGVLHHEPWGDEADAWLYARDAPWATFFRGAGYAGTPMLWYLAQAPFARAGLPYEAQLWVHWGIAAIGMAVFLFRAPFPLLARAAFAFSWFGVFEYAVVARSYSLTLLLLWCACATFRERRTLLSHGVWLALLAQTNVPGMTLAGALWAVGVLSGPPVSSTSKRGWVGIAVATMGLLSAALQVLPPDDGQKVGLVAEVTSTSFTTGLVDGLFPFGDPLPRAVLGGAALACILLALWRHRAALSFFLLTWAGLTFVFAFVYGGYLRHHGFIVVGFVAAVWLSREQATSTTTETTETTETTTTTTTTPGLLVPTTLIVVLFAPWVVEGLRALEADREGRFSNAPAMVSYLKRRRLIHRQFAVSFAATVIVPWLDRGKVWYPALRERRTYLPWNAAQRAGRKLGPAALAQRVRSTFKAGKRPLLLLHAPLPDPESSGFRLIHQETVPVISSHGERSWLYAPVEDPLLPETPPATAAAPMTPEATPMTADEPSTLPEAAVQAAP